MFEYDEWYIKDEEKSKSQPKETNSERVKLKRQKSDDKDLPESQSLESDKKAKEEKGLKI